MRAVASRGSVGVVLAASALLLSACGGGDTRTEVYKPPKVPDSGAFVFQLRHANTAQDTPAYQLLAQTGVLGRIVAGMNDTFKLPRDIGVVVTSTDVGPAYISEANTLVIGYPFIQSIANTFLQAYPNLTAGQLAERVVNVASFVLLHEMGHALVNQLDIPITAREEDAVDNLATVINVEAFPAGGNVVFDFADFFSLLQANPTALSFWDEHSFDLQRANDAVCHLYGSDPQAYANLAGLIPQERRVRCRDEWNQISSSWEELLKPYTQ